MKKRKRGQPKPGTITEGSKFWEDILNERRGQGDQKRSSVGKMRGSGALGIYWKLLEEGSE
jgi:hypothetical protein